MKAIALVLAAWMTAACTSETELGPCIGAFDDPTPGLVYKVSVWNLFLAGFFVETIVVPAIVVAKEVRCPVARVVQQ